MRHVPTSVYGAAALLIAAATLLVANPAAAAGPGTVFTYKGSAHETE